MRWYKCKSNRENTININIIFPWFDSGPGRIVSLRVLIYST